MNKEYISNCFLFLLDEKGKKERKRESTICSEKEKKLMTLFDGKKKINKIK